MLRAAFFRDFKGSDTLLIWGEHSDISFLHNEFYRMQQETSSGFLIEGGPRLTSLQVRLKSGRGVSMAVGTHEALVWSCSLDVITEYIDLVAALLTSTAAHQYVDARGGLADQIMISVNEYPDDFRP